MRCVDLRADYMAVQLRRVEALDKRVQREAHDLASLRTEVAALENTAANTLSLNAGAPAPAAAAATDDRDWPTVRRVRAR